MLRLHATNRGLLYHRATTYRTRFSWP